MLHDDQRKKTIKYYATLRGKGWRKIQRQFIIDLGISAESSHKAKYMFGLHNAWVLIKIVLLKLVHPKL